MQFDGKTLDLELVVNDIPESLRMLLTLILRKPGLTTELQEQLKQRIKEDDFSLTLEEFQDAQLRLAAKYFGIDEKCLPLEN